MVKIENHYCIKLSEIEDNNESQHPYLVLYGLSPFMELQHSFFF